MSLTVAESTDIRKLREMQYCCQTLLPNIASLLLYIDKETEKVLRTNDIEYSFDPIPPAHDCARTTARKARNMLKMKSI